jgi:class 3 adenylate cyclase
MLTSFSVRAASAVETRQMIKLTFSLTLIYTDTVTLLLLIANAELFPDVTILFADLVGFTGTCSL